MHSVMVPGFKKQPGVAALLHVARPSSVGSDQVKMIDRVLVLAAVHPDGEGTTEDVAKMLGITLNNARVNASFLRTSGHLSKPDGKGHLAPTVKGYKRALRLLKGKLNESDGLKPVRTPKLRLLEAA